MANPLIRQGYLNLTSASVSIPSNPALNITPSFLGRRGIRVTLEQEAVRYVGTMTGMVRIPEVYLPIRATIALLKTQALSDAYKTLMETNSFLGAVTIRPDITVGLGLSPYDFTDCALMSTPDLNFAGEEPDFVINIGGVYPINSAIWNA